MPAHHIGKCGTQRIGIKPTAQPQRHRKVVHRRRTLQLVDEPQPALGERQRNHRRPCDVYQRFELAFGRAQAGCQLCDGRGLEHGADRQPGVHAGVDGGDQAHCRQRIAA